MNDVTSSMINVFRVLLADGEMLPISEMLKALRHRPESETKPLWDFYTGHWVDWFVTEYEEALTRARHPLKLAVIDRSNNGIAVELYESRWAPEGYKLNTVAQVFVHDEEAAIQLQNALFDRLERDAPSAFIVPELRERKEYSCPRCGFILRPCSDPFCFHCDKCSAVITHAELQQM